MPESVKSTTEKNGINLCPHCGEKLKKLRSGVFDYNCSKCGDWNIRKTLSI